MILKERSLPVVVDADALWHLAANPGDLLLLLLFLLLLLLLVICHLKFHHIWEWTGMVRGYTRAVLTPNRDETHRLLSTLAVRRFTILHDILCSIRPQFKFKSSLNKNALNTVVGDKKHKLDAALNSFSSTCPFAGFQTHLQVQTLQLWLTLQRPSAMSQSSVR